MTNLQKALATILLSNLALTTWAAGPGRKDVPPGANEQTVLLEVRGVFEAKELDGEFIVLYEDPTKGSYSYLTLEGPTTGEDILDLGNIELEVTFDDAGALKTVEVWENEAWSTVPELEVAAIQKALRPLPDFDQVPKAWKPCKDAVYQRSQWILGCLVDFFTCGGERETGTAACCDGGVGPMGVLTDDCQKDHGVPLG
ncbi:MAG: hypothetical protein AAF657_11860 [Acidobacteriota bacterium]